MSQHLEIEHDSDWQTLWLNRPQVRNAMSVQMIDALIGALQDAATDAAVRGITLRGRGGVFCAGGDLKQFRSVLQGDTGHSDTVAANRRAGELFNQVANSPKPVIALIDGAAMAGGLGLACAADLVVVTRDARFALTETTLGIPPAQIAVHVVRRIGPALARQIMLTAARFDGEEARTLGIANFVVTGTAELGIKERQLRAGILRCAPGANAVTKALIAAVETLDDDAFVDRAARDFADCLLGEEGREGIAAFMEKRAPTWAREGAGQ